MNTEKARKQVQISDPTSPMENGDLFTAAYRTDLAGSLFEIIFDEMTKEDCSKRLFDLVGIALELNASISKTLKAYTED